MKTTLNLNDQLLTDAKALAARQRTSLTRLIEEGLQLRLRANEGTAAREQVRLPVFQGRGGLVKGVDPLATRRCSRRSVMTPDVNVLVAASRSDHPHHTVALRWLEAAIGAPAAGGTLTLMPMVLASFLRLVTSPRIFQQATPIDDAIAFVDALMASPGVRLAPLGPEWSTLRQLCLDKQLGGNDLPDAWLSAAVVHLGEHLVSFDRDFRKLLKRSQFTLLSPA